MQELESTSAYRQDVWFLKAELSPTWLVKYNSSNQSSEE